MPAETPKLTHVCSHNTVGCAPSHTSKLLELGQKNYVAQESQHTHICMHKCVALATLRCSESDTTSRKTRKATIRCEECSTTPQTGMQRYAAEMIATLRCPITASRKTLGSRDEILCRSNTPLRCIECRACDNSRKQKKRTCSETRMSNKRNARNQTRPDCSSHKQKHARQLSPQNS